MSPRPIPADLLPWALACLGLQDSASGPALSPVAGDASNRRYFRLHLPGASYIVVDAPPATEKNAAFLAVRELLAGAGVQVPELFAADLERGYLLLQDLGDSLLLPALDPDSVDGYYGHACAVLRRIAALDANTLDLPDYDRDLLSEEFSRFQLWFVEALLGCALEAEEQQMLKDLCRKLLDSAVEQPQVLVHRDFHSRNLMLLPDGGLGVIDFQDAVCGPITYDLVSLLRDCYIRWPADRVQGWALAHRDSLQSAGLLADTDDGQFLRWLDWMGLQRHIKVLGTFSRLYLRDGKAAYLEDLPLVIDYVRDIAAAYAPREPVFAAFDRWFEQRLAPRIANRHWSGAP